MLTGIHILMTYKCNLECDHCFLPQGRSMGSKQEIFLETLIVFF
jgi:MoaA/NifB/PqqE/SkfB family radical SAM enzyme